MRCPSGERKTTDNISTPTQQGPVFAFLRLEPAFTFIMTPVFTCGQPDTPRHTGGHWIFSSYVQ